MGLVWQRSKEKEKRLVIVEFKIEPKFSDIFQTKGYDELFNSNYKYLLSVKPLHESSRKVLEFVKRRPMLIKTKNGKDFIIIKILHKMPEGIITIASLGTDIGIFPDKVL